MTLVEEEAIKFSRRYLEGIVAKVNTFNNRISDKIIEFYNDKDKIFFLRTLQAKIEEKDRKHRASCPMKNCHDDELFKYGLYSIAQELERTEKYYQEEILTEDEFTSDEKVVLHGNINTVILQLREQGISSPEVEEELNSLKDSFSIGKKKWLKLLLGTTAKLTAEKIIEITIVNSILTGVYAGTVILGNEIGQYLINF